MKTSEPKPTKEGILNKHHVLLATGDYAPKGFKDAIDKAMQEYAEAFHKEKLREEQLKQAEEEPKELAEIKGKTCNSCKYGTGYYRCVTCDLYNKWEPIK